MITIELTETQPAVEVALPDQVGRGLAALDIVAAAPALTPGYWTIAPTTRVGVARIGDVEIWIHPKLPIDRLFFLLGYALTGRGWQDTEVDLTPAPDLLAPLARAFARQADKALQHGALQGYRTVEDSVPVLRGRLRATVQMQRRYGLMLPAEVRFDDYTIDIAENQLLRSAARRLLRLPRLPKDARRALLRLDLRLSPVTPLVPGQPLPPWHPDRLNARYEVALRLAELILAGNSVEQAHGSVRFDGFMINMARVFEDFVTIALRDALAGSAGHCRLQDRWHLDTADAIALRPDLVWYSDDRPTAVIDAKYKAEKPAGFPDADLYQMLAYCTALGLPRGHLVYAKGNESAAVHTVRNTGVEIVQHALDLALPPTGLLNQVANIAALIAASPSQAGEPSGLRPAAHR